jgi:hypothetical protein
MMDKVALRLLSSECFGFPCQFWFHQLLHTHHLSSGAATIGQFVANVPSGLSLTPPQETKKKSNAVCHGSQHPTIRSTHNSLLTRFRPLGYNAVDPWPRRQNAPLVTAARTSNQQEFTSITTSRPGDNLRETTAAHLSGNETAWWVTERYYPTCQHHDSSATEVRAWTEPEENASFMSHEWLLLDSQTSVHASD